MDEAASQENLSEVSPKSKNSHITEKSKSSIGSKTKLKALRKETEKIQKLVSRLVVSWLMYVDVRT